MLRSVLQNIYRPSLFMKRLFIGFILSLMVTACISDKSEGAEEKVPVAKVKKASSASVVTIPKNPQDGQFWTQARVNTGSIRFLVDTGAGMVALTETDAKKAGIKTRNLKYDVPISTAGGENMAARVTLDRVSVGAITVKNVDALIVPEGLDISLLGMTYLGELQSVQANRNSMTLRF
jgi:aspartyl protease family protein